MPPSKPVKRGPADQRVKHILSFAIATAQSLKDRSPITTNTVNELNVFVRSQPFPSSSAVALARKSADFDALGSSLWNAATRIIRDDEIEDDDGSNKTNSKGAGITRFGILLRAFAFFLLDAAHNESRRRKDASQTTRIFKIALKAVRCSLDNNDSELGAKILESCSRYVSAWDEATPIIQVAGSESKDEGMFTRKLTSEFYLLRMFQASKSRLDLAEHFFLKASVGGNIEGYQDVVEMAAEFCYYIGRSLKQEKRLTNSLSWLERAYNLLQTDDQNAFPSARSEDLRLVVVASYAEASAEQNDTESIQRTWDMVISLERDHGMGNRMSVLVMQLNILLRRPADTDAFMPVVSRMVTSSILTEQTFRTLLHSINKVKRVSFETALNALEQMITMRLLPDLDAAMGNEQVKTWLEKAIVTYTSLCCAATDEDKPGVLERIPELFDHVMRRAGDIISPRATHAIQALIWKASNDANALYAETWLGILQHMIFTNVGPTNKARISRKVMFAALQHEELDKARAAFYQLPSPSQNEGMTRYLAYKLALKSNGIQLAKECLAVLAKQSDKDERYLYACVLEAQRSNDRKMTVAAFQALVDQPPNSARLPALLRCTARMLMEELDNLTDKTLEDVTIELIRLFETATANLKILKQGTEEQWRAEVQWWSKNSFNIALRLCAELPPEQLIRLLRACVKILESLPDDSGLMHQDDLAQRKQICHFLCASANVVLGRSTEDRPQKLQYYLEAQREGREFLTTWQRQSAEPGATEAEPRRLRAFEMLKFNVESVFHLEQWDDLDTALMACMSFQGTARWDTLADLIIVIYERTSTDANNVSATSRIPALLQKIINETWSADKDIVKLARWLRFTFSIALNDNNNNSEEDDGISLKLTQQAASLARRGTEQRNDPYPEDELQWLATTAFNRAVDLLMADTNAKSGHNPERRREMGPGEEEEEDIFNRPEAWMQAALELARYANDNGALHALLIRTREEAGRRMTMAMRR